MVGEMEWEGESLCERTTSKPSTLSRENHYGPVVRVSRSLKAVCYLFQSKG